MEKSTKDGGKRSSRSLLILFTRLFSRLSNERSHTHTHTFFLFLSRQRRRYTEDPLIIIAFQFERVDWSLPGVDNGRMEKKWRSWGGIGKKERGKGTKSRNRRERERESYGRGIQTYDHKRDLSSARDVSFRFASFLLRPEPVFRVSRVSRGLCFRPSDV